jgi:hypothetical protein
MLTKLLHVLQSRVPDIELPLGVIEFLPDDWMASFVCPGAHHLEGAIRLRGLKTEMGLGLCWAPVMNTKSSYILRLEG